ncbi:glycerophosphoryl diester phosphodiesterase [Alteromonadaceae bacterium Bs31]|nr:glycerophosphoryl diester phosphodiesterase [Alteromonadaceae bacterium Bs31]
MKSNFKLVGHRGNPQRYPENSLASVRSAISIGVDAVEIDVQLSRDGVCMLLHDESLLRTTGIEKTIGELSAVELEAISAHEPLRFADKFNSTPLPSLEHFCRALANEAVEVFIELKAESLKRYSAEYYASAAISASQLLAGRRTLISYDEAILKALVKQSDVAIGWILDAYDEHQLGRARALQADFLIINKKLLPKDKRPLWSGTWQWFVYDSVDLSEAQGLAERGVDYIESWDPSVLAL